MNANIDSKKFLDVLQEWKTTVSGAEAKLTELSNLVGSTTSEHGFFDSMYRPLEAYTRMVAETVGFDAAALMDFWFVHSFGEKPMKLIRKVSGSEFWIRGVVDLVVYLECVAAADAPACPPCSGNCNQGRSCPVRS